MEQKFEYPEYPLKESPPLEEFKNNSSPDILFQNQRTLFSTWLIHAEKIGRKRLKVANKILNLPCGCTRGRNSERDPETIWHIKKVNETWIHSEYGKSI